MPLVTKLIIELIDIQDEENIYKKQKKQIKKEFIKNIKMKNENQLSKQQYIVL